MKRFILLALFAASSAYAGGDALGPPPTPTVSSEEPGPPLPQQTIDCIKAALEGDLNPITECDL